MNWYRLFAASALFTSSVLSATATIASAQVYAAPQIYPPELEPVVVRTVHRPHSFELFNNSQQDILYLTVYADSDPDNMVTYGGIRQLRPGRAWSVSLGDDCIHSVIAEYEDGSQVSHEGIDTCGYRGIELR